MEEDTPVAYDVKGNVAVYSLTKMFFFTVVAAKSMLDAHSTCTCTCTCTACMTISEPYIVDILSFRIVGRGTIIVRTDKSA